MGDVDGDDSTLGTLLYCCRREGLDGKNDRMPPLLLLLFGDGVVFVVVAIVVLAVGVVPLLLFPRSTPSNKANAS